MNDDNYQEKRKLTDSDKIIMKDAFPNFLQSFEKLVKEQEKRAVEELFKNIQFNRVQYNIDNNDVTVPSYIEFTGMAHNIDSYDNDTKSLANEIRNGIHMQFQLNGHNNKGINAHEFFIRNLKPQPVKKTRKKKPPKEYKITVINKEKKVGVEGIAVVDIDKINKQRIGRMPKNRMNKKLIQELKYQREAEEIIKREIEKNKKQYEIKLF